MHTYATPATDALVMKRPKRFHKLLHSSPSEKKKKPRRSISAAYSAPTQQPSFFNASFIPGLDDIPKEVLDCFPQPSIVVGEPPERVPGQQYGILAALCPPAKAQVCMFARTCAYLDDRVGRGSPPGRGRRRDRRTGKPTSTFLIIFFYHL